MTRPRILDEETSKGGGIGLWRLQKGKEEQRILKTNNDRDPQYRGMWVSGT